MLTPRGRFCAMCSGGSTLPKFSIRIVSFSNLGKARWGCTRHTAEWEGQTYDHPRHHSIALMCDEIERTVEELRAKGAQFRGPIEEREYGRVIMMIVPGADDIQ